MRHALPVLAAILVLPVAACGQNPSLPHHADAGFHRTSAPRLPLRVAADLVVRRAQFGILKPGADGDDQFVAGQDVPAEDGQAFGWVVEVDTTRESLHWQEHLKLPRPPADWGDAATDPDILIAADGRSVVAQGDDMIEDGELSRFYWTLAAGDPAGDYEMDVAIEGRPVAHFTFHVPATVTEKAILVRNHAPAARRAGRVAGLRIRSDRAGASVWR